MKSWSELPIGLSQSKEPGGEGGLPVSREMESYMDSERWSRIQEIAQSLHESGTFDPEPLNTLISCAQSRRIRCSVETGSGVSTLVLSQVSSRHIVFSVDAGRSISAVKNCGLLKEEVVEWMIGPTQVTLPRYSFTEPVQLALIDGPHAWPFPDMEYYYLYQQVEQGGLLIIDDIQIPTIRNMLNVLKVDPMWKVLEVVHNTAFLERTDAPMFCPTGDYWWEQPYNQTASPV